VLCSFHGAHDLSLVEDWSGHRVRIIFFGLAQIDSLFSSVGLRTCVVVSGDHLSSGPHRLVQLVVQLGLWQQVSQHRVSDVVHVQAERVSSRVWLSAVRDYHSVVCPQGETQS